jgi:hypothetical protein
MWVENIKGSLWKSIILGGGMEWIYLAQNGDGSQSRVDMLMIFHVP